MKRMFATPFAERWSQIEAEWSLRKKAEDAAHAAKISARLATRAARAGAK